MALRRPARDVDADADCVQHTPTGEEWPAWKAAETDEDRIAADPNRTSCFDVTGYATTPPPEPTCDVPPDLPEGESFGCVVVEPPRLTQRMVDDWNAFVDQEDSAGARRLGMTLEEYRATYMDERG